MVELTFSFGMIMVMHDVDYWYTEPELGAYGSVFKLFFLSHDTQIVKQEVDKRRHQILKTF